MSSRGSLTPLFLRACRREPVERTPIWLMRQAGRSLPEYRALRERWSLEEIVAQPELCAEVTLQPVRRLGVDAAVMFADIMLPLRGMGIDFELVESIGPVVANPIRTAEAVHALRMPPALGFRQLGRCALARRLRGARAALHTANL